MNRPGLCGMLSIEVIHMASPLLDKSLEFATQIVLFYEAFSKTRKDTTITKQLLRSATSIGAKGGGGAQKLLGDRGVFSGFGKRLVKQDNLRCELKGFI